MAPKHKPEFLVAEAELILAKKREEKAALTKDLGSPIQLPGKALDILIRDGHAWVAENTHVAKKIDLESGKVLLTFKGHIGPVTSLALAEDRLFTGSWDKTIKVWESKTGKCISTVEAHTDFVKRLLLVSSAGLLVSTGSDKTVRLWDTSHSPSLAFAGNITAHTRPVEALDARVISSSTVELCTGDTMGIIKLWVLQREPGAKTTDVHWRSTLKAEYNHHRTRINDLRLGAEYLWTASADEFVQVLSLARPDATPTSLVHPTGVRAILPLSLTELGEPYLITGTGDIIRVYDVASLEDPELIQEIDAHWHDVTAIQLWDRKYTGEDGKQRREPWIISTSLDGTLRKWRLPDLLVSKPLNRVVPAFTAEMKGSTVASTSDLTEEEERELAELMEDN